MSKVKVFITDYDLRDLAKICKVSRAGFSLGCYIIGQVDKWEHLKTWILIEQQKEKFSVELEET